MNPGLVINMIVLFFINLLNNHLFSADLVGSFRDDKKEPSGPVVLFLVVQFPSIHLLSANGVNHDQEDRSTKKENSNTMVPLETLVRKAQGNDSSSLHPPPALCVDSGSDKDRLGRPGSLYIPGSDEDLFTNNPNFLTPTNAKTAPVTPHNRATEEQVNNAIAYFKNTHCRPFSADDSQERKPHRPCAADDSQEHSVHGRSCCSVATVDAFEEH